MEQPSQHPSSFKFINCICLYNQLSTDVNISQTEKNWWVLFGKMQSLKLVGGSISVLNSKSDYERAKKQPIHL